MSDQVRDGSAADRKISTATATATGAVSGLVIGATHWAVDCMTGGHWHWIAPDSHLIDVAAPIVVLPVALWVARVLGLIGDIITNHLERDAKT